MAALTYQDACTALDQLYATLPRLVCQRQCQEACGAIIMSRLEWVRIQRRLGYTPKGKPSCTCPMLKQGGCAVYSIRPSLCRLWGTVDHPLMRCPYGCVPERWLSDAESAAVLRAAEALSQAVFPQEGQD